MTRPRSFFAFALPFIAQFSLCFPAIAQQCTGDCDRDRAVEVNEVVLCLHLALGHDSLGECHACDANRDGEVSVDELVEAVHASLAACETEPPVCGDGVKENTEECDDGGICFGSPNELAPCTMTGECPGGACRPAGGDGCAANCTFERLRRASLSGDSKAVIQLAGFPLSVPLVGSLGLTTGTQGSLAVDPQGELITRFDEYPVVIGRDDVVFEPVRVISLVCACVRLVETPSFGDGNSATGVIACGTEGNRATSYKMVQDHVTNPGAASNGNTPPVIGLQLPDDPECDDAFHFPNATEVSEACLEGTDAACSDPQARGQHAGTCNSPRAIDFFARDEGSGTALIDAKIAISLLNDGGVCRRDLSPGDPTCPPDYGPDCQPCTEDDADLGQTEDVPATTGWASAAVYDALSSKGRTMDVVDPPVPCTMSSDCEPGQRCIRQCELSGAACLGGNECSGAGDTCGEPQCSWAGCGSGAFYYSRCITSAHGKPFDCNALAADRTPDDGDGDGLAGATLAIAFPAVDSLRLGDNITTIVLDLE